MMEIRCHHVNCIVCGSRSGHISGSGQDYEYNTSDQVFSFTVCDTCGHEYLNPRPIAECLSMAYPEHYYTLEGRHTRTKSRIISRFKGWVINRRLLYFAPLLRSKARILEIGCGDGSLLLELKSKNSGLDVWGLDLSLSHETKETCRKHGIHLIESPVEQAEIPENFFDLIIMNQLIEHVEYPEMVIGKCSSALKKGGYISIETPNKTGYDRIFFKERYWGGYYFPRHLHLFDKSTMQRLLAKNRLDLVKHMYLLAPIIWAFSFHGLICHDLEPGPIKRLLTWFFSDRNPLCLSIFTCMDLMARMVFGFPTSNQKFIAVKRN